MDKYNTWLGKLLAKINGAVGYAITLGQTSYFSCSAADVDARWHKHEDCHKTQWAKDGIFKFAVVYLYYQVRYGYTNNPYEVEARAAEQV